MWRCHPRLGFTNIFLSAFKKIVAPLIRRGVLVHKFQMSFSGLLFSHM